MIKISESDLHQHLKTRMSQRGITTDELEAVLNEGWEAKDAKAGTLGKILVFKYNQLWEGELFEEKEVTVYYKRAGDALVLLTAKARYGNHLNRERLTK